MNIALQALLEKNGAFLPHVKGVYFDPFGECQNEQKNIHGILYRVRPSAQNPGKPQLCAPESYQEAGDDFSSCSLYKIVAWDHVSLPGNDFFDNNRFTDDGVSAAATNSMEVVTGIKGTYTRGGYEPPEGYESWEEVALKNKTNLAARGNVKVISEDGICVELARYENSAPKTRPPGYGR